MGNQDVSLIVLMLKEIKGTLSDHTVKIDNIKDISKDNHNDIENIKKDILDINSNQKTFVKKPKPGAIKFWFKLGSMVSAVIIGIYQFITK